VPPPADDTRGECGTGDGAEQYLRGAEHERLRPRGKAIHRLRGRRARRPHPDRPERPFQAIPPYEGEPCREGGYGSSAQEVDNDPSSRCSPLSRKPPEPFPV